MLKKIKIILTSIGILGITGSLFAKETKPLPLQPENPNKSQEDFCEPEPDCDTYVAVRKEEVEEAKALYAIPDVEYKKMIREDKEDIIEKYAIPDIEDEPVIEENKEDLKPEIFPVLKYGVPYRFRREYPPMVKYGIPDYMKNEKRED